MRQSGTKPTQRKRSFILHCSTKRIAERTTQVPELHQEQRLSGKFHYVSVEKYWPTTYIVLKGQNGIAWRLFQLRIVHKDNPRHIYLNPHFRCTCQNVKILLRAVSLLFTFNPEICSPANGIPREISAPSLWSKTSKFVQQCSSIANANMGINLLCSSSDKKATAQPYTGLWGLVNEMQIVLWIPIFCAQIILMLVGFHICLNLNKAFVGHTNS